jgi:nicotinate-nucleotide adenylyltransferase
MKIGLFFGSFNPVHIGHMILAESILEQTDIERIWFVVSPQNPFKEQKDLLNKEERLRMVNIAIDGDVRMLASDIEFHMPVPSYTCDTLMNLKEKYPHVDFYLIVGTDAWTQMPNWKNFEYIKTIPTIVYPRTDSTNQWFIRTLSSKKDTFIQAANMPFSSTLIRNNIAQGKHFKYYLPTKVFDYIEENKLYKK